MSIQNQNGAGNCLRVRELFVSVDAILNFTWMKIMRDRLTVFTMVFAVKKGLSHVILWSFHLVKVLCFVWHAVEPHTAH